MEKPNLLLECEPCAIEVLAQHWRERKYSYKSTPRPDFGLMYVTRGGVDFVSAEATVSAETGDVVFLPKGCRYEAIFRGETEDILVNFDVRASFSATLPQLLFPAPADIASLFDTMAADALLEDRPMRLIGRLYLLFDALSHEVKRDTKPYGALIERVYGYLHSDGDMSVSAIARACAISESGLRRIFKAHTGRSLLAERRAFRIKEAKRLLESTDFSLAEIAERLHFFDAAYFSRVFRGEVGVTPGEYARARKMRP